MSSGSRMVNLRNNKWTFVESSTGFFWPRHEEYKVQSVAGVHWRWWSDALPWYLDGKFTGNNVRLFIPGGIHTRIEMRSERNSVVLVL